MLVQMLGGYLPYAVLLLATAVVLVALSVYAWERRDRTGATPLAVFLLGEAIWCLCAFAGIVTRGTPWAPFWSRAWFVGVVITVAGLFVFALEYTGNEQYLTRWTYAALAIEPVLFLGTIALGPDYLVHDAVARTADTMLGWVIVPGMAFWLHSAYSYVLLVVTTALLIKFAFTSDTLRRRQAVALVASILIPWFGNVLSLFTDIGFDPTPMAFSISGVSITWAVFRGGLLDISPVAHREVVRSLNSAVLVVDTDERIIEVNEVTRDLLGTESVVGENVETALSDWPAFLEYYGSETAQRGEERTEITRGNRHFHVQDAPLFDDRGELVGRVFQIHEITDQKRRQLELERRNRQLDQFASVVSHDLRNPLNVASGSLALVRERVEPAEGESEANVGENFDRVERAHDRMQSLIERVLALSRDEEALEMRPQSLAEVARMAWAHVDTGEAALEIDTDSVVVGDEDQLLQLFENAFRNSVEHAGPDCRITIRTVKEPLGPGQVSEGFMIADDGPGIPESERESVFEHGYTTEDGGTGLGLAIIERIARAHGWSIRATEGPDGGLGLVISNVDLQSPERASPTAR